MKHTDCTHPATPAGRRACRTGNPAPRTLSPFGQVERDYAEAAGLVPRRAVSTSQKPARIQPRRSGARVSANASACVQAALHTGVGTLCACGWSS